MRGQGDAVKVQRKTVGTVTIELNDPAMIEAELEEVKKALIEAAAHGTVRLAVTCGLAPKLEIKVALVFPK